VCIFLMRVFSAGIAMALDALDGLHNVTLHGNK
jgi:hypothetical protein